MTPCGSRIGVASALEAAHRRGLVHRDVKPGNILITDDGDVKVTDFGIARAVAEASMTVTGTTLGSVHYFSPEQARGDEVTGSSDVYSLGIVLYEMLTGRRPFEADSAAGVALKRLNEDPPPPDVVRAACRSGLSAIVMRALQREPADRFPDAGSFAEALRTWQKDPSAAAAMAAAAGVAGAAAVAAVPSSGEPTVYVPPPVAMPSDRDPAAAAGRRTRHAGRTRAQPWWVWALLVLGILLLGLIGYLGVEVFGGLGPGRHAIADAGADRAARLRGPADRRRARRPRPAGAGAPSEEREPSDEFARNLVIRTDPEAGSRGERGRHHHGRHQRGRRHGGGAEPDRPDARRGHRHPERGRAAAWVR